MVPVAFVGMFTHHHLHLLGQQNLVQVVHVFVGIAIIIVTVGMLINSTCRVHLESSYTIINELFQMVHPVFLSAFRLSGSPCQPVFFRQTQVIILAKPQTQFESHCLQASGKQLVVFSLLRFVGHPIGFHGKLLIVPFLLCREVVALFHPLRFQPERIARHAHLAEMYGIAENFKHVLQHIRTKQKTVSPFGLQVGAPRDECIGIDDGRHVGTGHDIEIAFVGGVVDGEDIFLETPYIEEVLEGCVVEHAPSFATEHKRLGNLRMLVGCPHAQNLTSVLNMVATGRATAIEALPRLQTEVDDAVLFVVTGFYRVLGSLGIIVVANDAIVLYHLQRSIFFIDAFAKRDGERFSTFHKRHTVDDGIVLLVGEFHAAIFLVDGHGILGSSDGKYASFLLCRTGNRLPIILLHTIAYHQVLGKFLTRT